MLKLQRLIGTPVFERTTGKQVGTVKDAWFNERWELQGLVIESAKWLLTTVKAVTWDKVLACGEDTVLIEGEKAISHVKSGKLKRSLYTGLIKLKDMPVVTSEGLQLGRISDVYFYPILGTPVVGYELTDGFVSDMLEGRRWLKAPEDPSAVMLGEDAIIVPAVSEAELEPVAASNSKDRE